jgi:hypothetical protein
MESSSSIVKMLFPTKTKPRFFLNKTLHYLKKTLAYPPGKMKACLAVNHVEFGPV